MVPIARRILLKQKSKLIITVSGIGFSIMLMLFITGIHEGVKTGVTGYVANSPAQIWLCQKNSTNLLRSSSFLNEAIIGDVKNIDGIKSVDRILRIITTAQIHDKPVTLFLFGFRPDSRLGSPKMIEGSSKIKNGEIILDRSFAFKNRLELGDSIKIQDRDLRVAGFCTETNAIVAQFSFTTLHDAQNLIGFPNIISFVLVVPENNISDLKLMEVLKEKFDFLSIYTKKEFNKNNLEEMQTGVLPILWGIGIFAAISGAAVISLMLYGSILEKRDEYALLKAIGTSQPQLLFIVGKQSAFIAIIGYVLGLLLYIILSPAIVKIFPELYLSLTWQAALMVLVASLVIGVFGAIIPINKLYGIYPAEVFRA